jgi:TP901 family phage tail tape measure protein
MAKTISDEQMKLTMIINGDSAQKELFDLEKATRSLNEQNKENLRQKKLLETQGKKDTDQYRSLTASIKANTTEITENKNRMSELQKELGLTGLTMGQLQSKATMLRNTLRNLVPGSEDYNKYKAELTQVSERMNEVNGRATTARMSIGSLADGFNRYAALGASVVAMGTGVVLSLQKMIDMNAKLSDAQSNVMKTTGMTKVEVDELTKSFGMLQTRTARIDLLGIAESGGRLGIAKAEIQDFVKVMDKASVALGDSFEGGPEVVAEKLGKIKNLFQQTKDVGVEIAFESIGSALNDLGAAGTASEANVAEFVTRIGSMPEAFKPSIEQALGLGAAFEESGLNAEKSASNYSKVITLAANNVAGFAQVMNKPKKAIEDLINTNPNEFFLQFSESLKGLSGTDLAKVLDGLKLNDNEVKQVLGAASQNTDMFREKIDLANKSINDASSLTNEFDIKNNNLAATLEKLKKSLIGAFSSETIVNGLASAVNWFSKFVGATEDAEGTVSAWRNTLVFVAKALAVVTAAIITNVAWQKLVALWTNRNTEGLVLNNLALRAKAITEGISIVVTQAYAAVTMLLTGNIKGATQAIRVMATTMKTTPWGLIIGLIAAVAVAYVAFSEKASQATKIQQTLADVHLEATKSISKEKSELELLTKIAKDENLSKEQRLKAINKLNEIIPDYIGKLTLENLKTMEGTNILKKYTDELYKNARAKAAQSKFDELAKKELEIQNKSGKQYKSSTGQFLAKVTGQDDGLEFKNRQEVEAYILKTRGAQLGMRKDKATGATLVNKKMFNTLVDQYVKDYGIADKESELADVKAEMDALLPNLVDAKVNELNKNGTTKEGSASPVGASVPTEKAKKDKTPKKYDDSYLRDQERLSDELLKIRKKSEEDTLALMDEGYAKELEKERINHKYKVEELKQQLVTEAQLKIVDKDIAIAKKAGDSPKVKALESIKKMMLEKNKEINYQIENEDKMHLARTAVLQEKATTDILSKEKEAFDRAKTQRETAFLEELNGLDLSEEEREKRKKDFQAREIEEEKKFLRGKIDELNTLLANGSLSGFDFSLLTPEAKEKLQQDIEAVKNALAKMNENNPNATQEGAELDLGLGGEGKDILGFSKKQWEDFLTNIEKGTIGIQTLQMAYQLATQVVGQMDQAMTASENAAVKKTEAVANRKKVTLKKQLDQGLISKVQYDKKVEKLDQEVEDKKFEIELKQAKRKKAMSIVDTVVNTAVAVMQAYSQLGPIGGTVAAALIGVMGAMQVAAIAKQPLPTRGYEEGLYPDYVTREQDGKKFKSSYQGKTRSGLVSKTSHFLVAENGPEMVIDNKAWRQMDPAVKEALVRNLQGIKGFENGMYNTEKMRYEVAATSSSPASSTSDAQLLQMVLSVLAENTQVMRDLKQNGVIGKFFKNDYQSAKNIEESIKEYNDLRNKNKI